MTNGRNAATGFKRGLARRCPNCGEGHLFRGYLKVDPVCEACGHDNGAYRADDGPTYFTVLIVGHLLIAPLLAIPFVWRGDPLIVLPIALTFVGAATLALLAFVKGAFIGVQWGTRATATQ
ncbi:MAG: DUF983 domain-containing protein [Proteobacteria bacterium]|nr:DUF983 domain-containing protein [Pseudomonadota bacterium]